MNTQCRLSVLFVKKCTEWIIMLALLDLFGTNGRWSLVFCKGLRSTWPLHKWTHKWQSPILEPWMACVDSYARKMPTLCVTCPYLAWQGKAQVSIPKYSWPWRCRNGQTPWVQTQLASLSSVIIPCKQCFGHGWRLGQACLAQSGHCMFEEGFCHGLMVVGRCTKSGCNGRPSMWLKKSTLFGDVLVVLALGTLPMWNCLPKALHWASS